MCSFWELGSFLQLNISHNLWISWESCLALVSGICQNCIEIVRQTVLERLAFSNFILQSFLKSLDTIATKPVIWALLGKQAVSQDNSHVQDCFIRTYYQSNLVTWHTSDLVVKGLSVLAHNASSAYAMPDPELLLNDY